MFDGFLCALCFVKGRSCTEQARLKATWSPNYVAWRHCAVTMAMAMAMATMKMEKT
jgi:hypothetical protein